MRTWSVESSPQCVLGSQTGFNSFQNYKYISASCTTDKQISISACSDDTCQTCIAVSPPIIREGICNKRTRYYCDQLPMNITSTLKISEYSDDKCTVPIAFNPYSYLNSNCYQREFAQMERATCQVGSFLRKYVEYTYWIPLSGAPPLSKCEGGESGSVFLHLGECVLDNNFDGVRYIRVDECSFIPNQISIVLIVLIALIDIVTQLYP